ncbi:MAG: DUF2065 family protein [Deinococcus-Thermus bacterium]|jgi:hypothetical protein|nr:DUF2065 family protein [Deinococcota bacterium]
MQDLATALALVLVLEGLLYAAFPEAMKRMLASVLELPPAMLRGVGLGAAAVGLILVWLIRG